jgi:hypothetical protein
MALCWRPVPPWRRMGSSRRCDRDSTGSVTYTPAGQGTTVI